MPRKFRRYVQKKASRKPTKKAVLSSSANIPCEDAPKSSDGMKEATAVDKSDSPATQEVSAKPIVITINVSYQTDSDVALDELVEDQVLPEPESLCEGNNDVKFHPLILKHKGKFPRYALYWHECLLCKFMH